MFATKIVVIISRFSLKLIWTALHLSPEIGWVELDGDEVDEDEGGGGAELPGAVDELGPDSIEKNCLRFFRKRKGVKLIVSTKCKFKMES